MIEESEKTKQERKKDRVLSRIDGFFYSLIALSTFTSGLIISQHDFLTSKESGGLLFPNVAAVLSMLLSFITGFKGMLYDSMENRIYAWCLLLIGFVFYLTTALVWVAIITVPMSRISWSIISIVAGLTGGLLQVFLSKKLTDWVEAKLSPILGQKIDVWKKINSRIVVGFLTIIIPSAAITIIAIVLLQKT